MHFILFKIVNRLQLTHYVQSLKDVVIINIFLGARHYLNKSIIIKDEYF